MAKIPIQILDYKGDPTVLCERVSGDLFDTKAQVIVQDTFYAIMVKGGVCNLISKGGTYNIFDIKKVGLFARKPVEENVDILFISKTAYLTSRWGTNPPLNVFDSETATPYQIGFHGAIDINITDPMAFYQKVVGSIELFVLSNFADKLRSTVSMFVADRLNSKLKTYKYYEIDSQLIALSSSIRGELEAYLSDLYGIAVRKFEISTSFVSQEQRQRLDNARRAIAEEKRAQEARRDETEARRDYLDVVRDTGVWGAEAVASLDGRNKCPRCNTAVDAGAKFCPGCGSSLVPSTCPSCGRTIKPGSTFCSGCGKKLV